MDIYKILTSIKKSKLGSLFSRKGFPVVAGLVLFLTTYVLILPAVTKSTDVFCGKEEHSHLENCYQIEKKLTCTIPEEEGHHHDSSCYIVEEYVSCGMEETEGHQHSDRCYDEEGNLICQLEESSGHHHTEDCYSRQEILTCEKAESDGHQHGDACYEEEKKLICNKEEHKHTEECYINYSADVESPKDWENTIKGVSLTGRWGEDAVAIARTQIGYKESTRNYQIDDNGDRRGYSRYGQWYGKPYDPWSATFVSFAYYYADVPGMPLESNANNLLLKLHGSYSKDYKSYDNYYSKKQVADGEYQVKVGDLVFFNLDSNLDADHVGIIYEITTEHKNGLEIPKGIKTIEGDRDQTVKTMSYSTEDSHIIGYGQIPENPTFAKAEELSTDPDAASGDYGQEDAESTSESDEDSEADKKKDSSEIAEIEKESTAISVETTEQGPVSTETSTETMDQVMSTEISTEAETSNLLTPLSYTGPDYTITATYSREAMLPDEVSLQVRELKGQELVEKTQQAQELMGLQAITYARFFDITFMAEDQEVEPAAPVQIEITYQEVLEMKDDDKANVVHFGKDGTELLSMSERVTKDGQTICSFEQDSFSVTGTVIGTETLDLVTSAPMLAAAASGAPAIGDVSAVHTTSLEVGEWYILYGVKSGETAGYAIFSLNPLYQIPLKQASTNRGSVTYEGENDIAWEWTTNGFRNRNGQYLTLTYNNDYRSSTIGLSTSTDNAKVTYNSTYKVLYNTDFVVYHTRYNELFMHDWQEEGWYRNTGYSYTSLRTIQNDSRRDIYIAKIGSEDQPSGSSWRHPQGAITGEPSSSELTLFNIDASDSSSIRGLSGVEYTIYDSEGHAVKSLSTTNDLILHLGTLEDGTYTVKQTEVPNGYVLNPEERSFTVSNGTAYIGLFFDYKQGFPGYVNDKTAEVVDYINRTYKINLSAASGEYKYTVDNIKYQLVVDQSNSMLFPSELTPVMSNGQPVKATMYQISNSTTQTGRNGKNLTQLVNEGKLDINKVYYMIADETQSSTVYAIWHDGQGWCYQDAAYYCKAQMAAAGITHNTTEYSTTYGTYYPEYAVYNKGYSDGKKTGGGGLDYVGRDSKGNTVGVGGTLGAEFGTGKSMTLYEGSTYNRLHDLQQAVTIFGAQLGSLNDNTSMDLITFDKEVESCISIARLNGDGIMQLYKAVDQITTSGGTRQDKALQHVLGSHGGNNSANHTRSHLDTTRKNIVILITDGAPVRSSGDTAVTVESCITVGNTVKNNSNVEALISVGLSTKNVTGGTKFLSSIASTSKRTGTKYYYESERAGELSDILVKELLLQFGDRETLTCKADIKDVISDSFYPIDPATNKPLTDGTHIDLQGNVSSTGPGTLYYDEETGWYVTWDQQNLPVSKSETDGWHGTVFLKAKEDFIGGNSIDTNKEASVTIIDSKGNKADTPITLSIPNVNVRLLEFTKVDSEETIFLGDKIQDIREKMEAFIERTVVEKIVVPSTGDVYNKVGKTEEDGLYGDHFTVGYAIRPFTDDEWNQLLAGEPVKVDYIYDKESSGGAVGYFTFTMRKEGDTASTADHTRTHVGNDVEMYILDVTYTAYSIQEREKPNDHNGDMGPGREVGTGDSIPRGRGMEGIQEFHVVNVIAGRVKVTKEIDQSLVSDQDQIFTFYLDEVSKERSSEEDIEPDADYVAPPEGRSRGMEGEEPDQEHYRTIEVVVKAGETEGFGEIGRIKRGTFVLREKTSEEYLVQSVAVQDDTTCVYKKIEDGDSEIYFTIGTNQSLSSEDQDVIVPVHEDQDGLYIYTAVAQGLPLTEMISYEHGKIVNKKARYTGEIPVKKIWDDGNEMHEKDEVYVMLYKDGNPVLDEAGCAKILKLHADNEWKGSFTVPKLKKNDNVFSYGYEVREVSEMKTREAEGYIKAIEVIPGIGVETSGEAPASGETGSTGTILYVKTAAADDFITINDTLYQVTYETDGSQDTEGQTDPTTIKTLVVRNKITYELPKTGGIGTTTYTLSGIILMILACMCSLILIGYRSRKDY